MNIKLTKLLVVALSSAVVSAEASVLSGPVLNPSNGHLYYLLSQNTWTGAEAEAVALGGHLVAINDAAENQWVFDNFSSFGSTNRYLWIGLHDIGSTSEFNWVWTNGEPSTYSNWSPVEPNSHNEQYAYIYPNGAPVDSFKRYPATWNNYRDTSQELGQPLLGVAETVPEPATVVMLLPGFVVMYFRRRVAAS